ncbi:MAG: hypothetical protein ACRC46_09955 [Thermoguttaceae bacterium]
MHNLKHFAVVAVLTLVFLPQPCRGDADMVVTGAIVVPSFNTIASLIPKVAELGQLLLPEEISREFPISYGTVTDGTSEWAVVELPLREDDKKRWTENDLQELHEKLNKKLTEWRQRVADEENEASADATTPLQFKVSLDDRWLGPQYLRITSFDLPESKNEQVVSVLKQAWTQLREKYKIAVVSRKNEKSDADAPLNTILGCSWSQKGMLLTMEHHPTPGSQQEKEMQSRRERKPISFPLDGFTDANGVLGRLFPNDLAQSESLPFIVVGATALTLSEREPDSKRFAMQFSYGMQSEEEMSKGVKNWSKPDLPKEAVHWVASESPIRFGYPMQPKDFPIEKGIPSADEMDMLNQNVIKSVAAVMENLKQFFGEWTNDTPLDFAGTVDGEALFCAITRGVNAKPFDLSLLAQFDKCVKEMFEKTKREGATEPLVYELSTPVVLETEGDTCFVKSVFVSEFMADKTPFLIIVGVADDLVCFAVAPVSAATADKEVVEQSLLAKLKDRLARSKESLDERLAASQPAVIVSGIGIDGAFRCAPHETYEVYEIVISKETAPLFWAYASSYLLSALPLPEMRSTTVKE